MRGVHVAISGIPYIFGRDMLAGLDERVRSLGDGGRRMMFEVCAILFK